MEKGNLKRNGGEPESNRYINFWDILHMLSHASGDVDCGDCEDPIEGENDKQHWLLWL